MLPAATERSALLTQPSGLPAFMLIHHAPHRAPHMRSFYSFQPYTSARSTHSTITHGEQACHAGLLDAAGRVQDKLAAGWLAGQSR